MKGVLNLLVAVYSIIEVAYYLYKCPSIDCRDSIFGFEVSGIVYLLFWVTLAVVDIYVYFKNRKQKHNIS